MITSKVIKQLPFFIRSVDQVPKMNQLSSKMNQLPLLLIIMCIFLNTYRCVLPKSRDSFRVSYVNLALNIPSAV